MKTTYICPKCGYQIFHNRKLHTEKCDGQGPKRIREAKQTKYGTKEFSEMRSNIAKNLWKNKEYKENMRNALKGNCSGKASTEEKELKRVEKIRSKILERYANGWEVKCGRCKKIDYESPIAGKIKVDGSWELKVAQYLDSINVIWKRNKKRFKYNNLIKNKISTYCPDFWVEDWHTYIEVKGYETELDRCKWNQFCEPLQVWKKEKLKELGLI